MCVWFLHPAILLLHKDRHIQQQPAACLSNKKKIIIIQHPPAVSTTRRRLCAAIRFSNIRWSLFCGFFVFPFFQFRVLFFWFVCVFVCFILPPFRACHSQLHILTRRTFFFPHFLFFPCLIVTTFPSLPLYFCFILLSFRIGPGCVCLK